MGPQPVRTGRGIDGVVETHCIVSPDHRAAAEVAALQKAMRYQVHLWMHEAKKIFVAML